MTVGRRIWKQKQKFQSDVSKVTEMTRSDVVGYLCYLFAVFAYFTSRSTSMHLSSVVGYLCYLFAVFAYFTRGTRI
jgi:multisubunit Na+/H+ antiporter MnhG subunit